MTWLKIDDEFVDNKKVASVSDRAFRLHVAGLCHCAHNLTDGVLEAKAVKVLGVKLEFNPKRYVSELVAAGLWHLADDGWTVNDYLEFNPAAATVKKVRSERSAAGKRGADQRWADGKTDGKSHGNRDGKGYGTAHMPQSQSPVPKLKAVTADQEITYEVQRLMRHLTKVDEGTEGVLLSIAKKLPVSSIAKVRESCQTRKVGAGYAVKALQSELAELEEIQQASA